MYSCLASVVDSGCITCAHAHTRTCVDVHMATCAHAQISVGVSLVCTVVASFDRIGHRFQVVAHEVLSATCNFVGQLLSFIGSLGSFGASFSALVCLQT